MTLLTLDRAVKTYRAKDASGRPAVVRALQEASLSVGHGDTVALVGESGCGKSTTARLVLGLERPDSGTVTLTSARQRDRSGPIVRAVFQNPRSSLNPRRRVSGLIRESIGPRGKGLKRSRIDDLVAATLEQVGLAAEHGDVYPHQLSGGQQQRVAIAAAIIAEPELIVLDEPTSALDVSIAAQVLNLLIDLQERLGCAYLVITHDLSMARLMARRVAVMYLGRIVEQGVTTQVLVAPRHPYTRALIDAEPVRHPRDRRRGEATFDEVPSPLEIPNGCAYHPRCPRNDGEACIASVPLLGSVDATHDVACFHPIDGERLERRRGRSDVVRGPLQPRHQ